jgi:hypothetical protein
MRSTYTNVKRSFGSILYLRRNMYTNKMVMLICVALALIAAVAYILTAAGVFAAGDLNIEEVPAILYVAGAFYIIVGLLILLNKRRVWITFAVLNAFVIAIFIQFYYNRTDVLFSAAGLATKIPQIMLEVGLLYLIFTRRKRALVESQE